MPEITKPTTPQLTESEVAKIETRLLRITGVEMANGRHPASWDEVAALIRDWRAMRARIVELEDLLAETRSGFVMLQKTNEAAERKCDELQSQLAQVTSERDALRKHAQDLNHDLDAAVKEINEHG